MPIYYENRVFRDKPGGLVVDYLGLADQLKEALITSTESGGQGNPTFDTAQAIAVMLEKHVVACDMMHGFSWDKWTGPMSNDELGMSNGRNFVIRTSTFALRQGQVIDVFTAAGLERQRRGTFQPRATPWDRGPIGSSP